MAGPPSPTRPWSYRTARWPGPGRPARRRPRMPSCTRAAGPCCPDSSTRTPTWSSRGSAAPSSRPGWPAARTGRAASSRPWPRPGPPPTRPCARTCGGWPPRCSGRARPRSSASPGTGSPSATRRAGSPWPPRSRPRSPTSARTSCRPNSPATRPATWTWCAARCCRRAPRTPGGSTCSARTGRSARRRRPPCWPRAGPRDWAPAFTPTSSGPDPASRWRRRPVPPPPTTAPTSAKKTWTRSCPRRWSRPCCPGPSSAPGTRTPTRAGCWTRGPRWRWPPTATRAPRSPPACRSVSRWPSATCG